MKYELPKDLKRYKFFCADALLLVDYMNCKKHCHSDYRHCWEQHLRKDLVCDCAVSNERKAELYVKCPTCGSHCTGLAFNRYLCSNCGNVEYYDAEQQKILMGNDYVEIDEQELANVLRQVV